MAQRLILSHLLILLILQLRDRPYIQTGEILAVMPARRIVIAIFIACSDARVGSEIQPAKRLHCAILTNSIRLTGLVALHLHGPFRQLGNGKVQPKLLIFSMDLDRDLLCNRRSRDQER